MKSNINITRKLKLPQDVSVIEHFEDMGWTFRLDEWEDGHNGWRSETLMFKSPRMLGEVEVPRIITGKSMCDREAWALACEYVRHNEQEILSQAKKDKYKELGGC